MTKDSSYRFNKKIIIMFLVFSCITTYFAYSFSEAYGFGQTTIANSDSLSDDDVSMLGGAFAPLVGIGGSPFIALTMLSGAGSLLNSGTIDAANIPFANTLMTLPISHTGIFITLLVITTAKFLLSMLSVSKVFCDATLGKLESMTGTVCAAGGAFLVTSVTTVYAAEIALSTAGNVGIGTYILTNVIAFFGAVVAYAIYYVMRTMVLAIDVLAFLFSPIPGSAGLFTILKHIIISVYTWAAISNPAASTVVGIVLVVAACLVFRQAKRLELYYRRVYLIPFANSIFRSGHRIPLIPKKLPRGVAAEFSDIDICFECFFMNNTSKFFKRERCYFVRSGEVNYLFKKRLFGKTLKVEVLGDTYIEKPFIFRFLRIFTDEALHANMRKVYLVVRREHGKDIAEIIEKTRLIDYNAILEERQRRKAQEMTLKAQQMKEQAAEKFSDAGGKIKRFFGGNKQRK